MSACRDMSTSITERDAAVENNAQFDVNDKLMTTGSDPVSSTANDLPLSKNKLRKLRRHEIYIQNKPLKRQRERESRKKNKKLKSLGNQEKLAIAEKLSKAINNSPKVVIDCQYDKQMTQKEQTRFAHQLRRSYSSNKAADQPLHLILTSLSKSSEFFGICSKQNDGFAKYIVDMQEKSVLDLYPLQNIVYLSPDSSNVLEEFDSEKIYVIGGLVDETTQKNISLTFSKSHNISTARLPIEEYFNCTGGTFKKILTVNQVFDIILEWYHSKDWTKSILAGLPERTGFIPKTAVVPESNEILH